MGRAGEALFLALLHAAWTATAMLLAVAPLLLSLAAILAAAGESWETEGAFAAFAFAAAYFVWFLFNATRTVRLARRLAVRAVVCAAAALLWAAHGGFCDVECETEVYGAAETLLLPGMPWGTHRIVLRVSF